MDPAHAHKGGGIHIFSKEGCRYCSALAALLTELDLPYRVIKVSEKDKAVVANHTGMKTFPMLYFGNELIGGYDNFCQLVNFNSEVLEQKLIANNINVKPKQLF